MSIAKIVEDQKKFCDFCRCPGAIIEVDTCSSYVDSQELDARRVGETGTRLMSREPSGEIVTCWKVVVSDCPGVYCSMSSMSHYALRYNLGERTIPKVGGVLAFCSRQLAIDWMISCCWSVTPWSAVLRGRGEMMPLPAYRALRVQDFEALWAGDSSPGSRLQSMAVGPWPEGTIALRWFEPDKVAPGYGGRP